MKTNMALFQALLAGNVPAPKAEAVIQALESDMLTLLATKSDLTNLENRITAEIAKLDSRLTIRMGVFMSGLVGALALMKFL